MSQKNVEKVLLILQGTQAGVAAGDLRGAIDAGLSMGIIDSDLELVPAPELAGGVTYRGPEGFVEFLRVWTEDFADWTVELERTIEASEDRVVAILHQRGTGKRSGVPIDLSHGGVFEFDAGRLIRARIFASPDAALEALGLSE